MKVVWIMEIKISFSPRHFYTFSRNCLPGQRDWYIRMSIDKLEFNQEWRGVYFAISFSFYYYCNEHNQRIKGLFYVRFLIFLMICMLESATPLRWVSSSHFSWNEHIFSVVKSAIEDWFTIQILAIFYTLAAFDSLHAQMGPCLEFIESVERGIQTFPCHT